MQETIIVNIIAPIVLTVVTAVTTYIVTRKKNGQELKSAELSNAEQIIKLYKDAATDIPEIYKQKFQIFQELQKKLDELEKAKNE